MNSLLNYFGIGVIVAHLVGNMHLEKCGARPDHYTSAMIVVVWPFMWPELFTGKLNRECGKL
jgi:hypothetical protein